MTTHLIPLGMRCSAVQITNAIVSQPRFPFDWAQMNSESMRDVIHLKPTEIRKFWTDYFSSIDDTKHTITGSWFPHDEFTDEEKEKTIDKYVRRTERLHSVLNLQSHVTYVIVFGFPEQDTMEKVLELTFAICCRQQGQCSFIICNGMIPEVEKENMTFVYEKLGESNGFQDWENLTTTLERRIRKLLEEKNIKSIPFLSKPLIREGYGSQFNDIFIQENMFIKIAKNEYGKKKMNMEQQAYAVFQQDSPSFPLAKLYYFSPTSIHLQYYKDYIPLWKFYKSVSRSLQDIILNNVFQHLLCLHSTKQKTVIKEEFFRLVYQETIIKIKERYKEIKHILDEYPFTKVNGKLCLSFEECITLVEQHTQKYIEHKKLYELCYIHGDPQFNNILIHPETKHMIFIDPRGYFGDSILFGIEDYDKAKVMFALSGYDFFDNTHDFILCIEENNIIIPDFTLDERYISMNTEIHFLLASIWLANSHCFLSNPNKAVISHAIARSITTKLLG